MQKIPRRGVSVESNAVIPESNLQTVEELKRHKGQLLNAELAPLSTRQVMDLVRAVRSTDQLRLNYAGFSQGPNHVALHRLMERARAQDRKIEEVIEASSSEFAPKSSEFMMSCLGREREMLECLKEMLESVDQIRNRTIGSQEG